jgi:anaerobic selenocysteine-containing dehydrogenase
MTVEIKKSFCHLCLAECGINVTVQDNNIIKVAPDFDDPVSQGYICEKSQRLIEFQSSPDRITSPLKKVNGEFIPISWEQAIDEVAIDIKPHLNSILYMAPLSPSYNATTLYSYELMVKLGVRYATNVLSFEKAYSLVTHQLFFTTGVIPNKQKAQTLIVIGQNPWITQHYPRARKILNDIKNDTARTLIVVDPVVTETANIADKHVKIAPGTDAWLLTAIIKKLIMDKAIDIEFIATHTSNFDKVNQHFAKVNLDECLSICNISYHQLTTIVNIIKDSESIAIDSGNGICHSMFPFANNYLIILLYLLTGNYQKPNSMESMNSVLSCISHYLIATQTPTNKPQCGGVISGSLITDNLNFGCVIIDNSNPVNRVPNATRFKSQLEKVPLVIVLDSFMTASAKMANYILPTPTFLERYECVNTFHAGNGMLQLSRPVLTKSYTKSTNEIYELLLAKLNLLPEIKNKEIDTVKFYTDLLVMFEQRIPEVYYILRNTIGLNYQTPLLAIVWWELFRYNINIDVDTAFELTTNQIKQLNDIGSVNINTHIQQLHRIDLAPSFLLSTLKLPKQRIHNLQYKFVLQCGYRQKTTMNEVIKPTTDPLLEIAEADATNLGIVDTEQVLLETSLTTIVLTCKLVSNSQPGLLRIANHPIINQLTNDNNIDYLSPQYKFVFANIRKINGNM